MKAKSIKNKPMRYLFVVWIFLIILFSSCNKPNKKNLELLVENDTIINKGLMDTCINVIKFSIRNNSDKTYYINNLDNHKLKPINIGIYSDGINIYISDQNGEIIKSDFSHFKGDEYSECAAFNFWRTADMYERKLGYNRRVDYFRNAGFRNFFIHPNQIMYFEHPIDLSGSIGLEIARIGYADLDKNKKYYAKVSFASDSSMYKSTLPRDILKTIKANNAEVFSGRLESDKIPIKFVK